MGGVIQGKWRSSWRWKRENGGGWNQKCSYVSVDFVGLWSLGLKWWSWCYKCMFIFFCPRTFPKGWQMGELLWMALEIVGCASDRDSRWVFAVSESRVKKCWCKCVGEHREKACERERFSWVLHGKLWGSSLSPLKNPNMRSRKETFGDKGLATGTLRSGV